MYISRNSAVLQVSNVFLMMNPSHQCEVLEQSHSCSKRNLDIATNRFGNTEARCSLTLRLVLRLYGCKLRHSQTAVANRSQVSFRRISASIFSSVMRIFLETLFFFVVLSGLDTVRTRMYSSFKICLRIRQFYSSINDVIVSGVKSLVTPRDPSTRSIFRRTL